MSPSHALTQIGQNFNRRAFYRRDANCPAFLFYKKEKQHTRFEKVAARVVNLSEGDILLLVDGVKTAILDVYVVLPLIKAKIPGKLARQGDFTVAVQFKEPLPAEVVDKVASIEVKRPQEGG